MVRLCLVLVVVQAILLMPGAVMAQDDVPEVVRSLLDQAARAAESGRTDDALDLYRQARELGPQVVQVYVDQGALLAGTGDFEAALEAFEGGLRISADDRDLGFNAAVAALRLGRFDVAARHAQRVVEGHPRDVDARLLQASALERLERHAEALSALRAADDLAPGNPRILYRLGNQYQRTGQAEQAVDAYRQAIRRDKKLLPAHFNLGAVLFELGRLDEALDAYEIALEPIDEAFRKGQTVDPVNALAYRNLGAIHLQASDFQKAVQAYSKARQLAPSDAQVLYNLGFANYRLSLWDAAREAYESALLQDADLPVAYLHLGQIAVRKGEWVEATARLEAGVPQLSGDEQTEALRALARAYRETGRGGDAEQAYRRVLDASGDDPQILLALGRLAREDGRMDETRSLLERARQAAPGDVEVGLELAGVLGQTDDTAAQKALYGDLLSAHSGSGGPALLRVRLALALLELAEGNATAAAGHLEQLSGAKGLDDESRAVVAALRGVLRADDGDLDGARKLLRQATDARSVAAGDALAVVDALAGRGDDAVKVLQASLAKADPKTPVGSALRLDTGLLLWSLGRHDEARPHLEAAFRSAPDEPALRAAVGDLALRDGDLWQAVEHLGRAEELCNAGGGRAAPSADTGRVFQVQLAGSGGEDALCDWVEQAVGATRVAAALDTLPGALLGRADARATLSLVEAALTGPLGTDLRAAALFVRGTLRLASGQNAAAAQDLSGAVDGGLPQSLASHARNNLGVAYARLGRHEEARQLLETSRVSQATSQPATLNLAILYDDFLDDGRRALDLYDDYLQGGGRRTSDARAWAGRLRELYP